MAHFAGLLLLFQQPTLLVPVFATSSHNTISKLFRRYLDTFIHIKSWYHSDLFDKKSAAAKSVKKVNLMHRVVYRNVNPGLEPNANDDPDVNKKLFMTQYDMVVTQWSSIAPVVLWPEKFGFHQAKNKDLEAFAHYWRAIGYTLGIEDRFNCCLDTLPETQYFCNLILENDFMPYLKREVPDLPKYGIDMSVGLARALNCMAPMLCLQGLLRYTYKTVLELPTYIEVKNRTGYRNLVYLIQTMMQKSYWHWIVSYLLKFALLCVSLRRNTIELYYERKFAHVDYQKDFEQCPYSKKWC